MDLYNSKGLFMGRGLIYGVAYTWGNNKISKFKLAILFLFQFQFQLKIFDFIVEAIALQGDISFRKLFVKNGFR